MTNIEAKKTIVHAFTLAFGYAPSQKSIVLSYFSDDNGAVDVDFSVCDTDYGLIYCHGEYILRRKNFYGYGHDLVLSFLNE